MKDYHSQYKSWILTYFKTHHDDTVTATTLFDKMKQAGMSVNLATVYRNLDRLEAVGQIRGHHLFGKKEKYYQYLPSDHACGEHLHLYCKKCGRVMHLDCEFMQEIAAHLLADHGFALDCNDSVLVGLCDDCRGKEENA